RANARAPHDRALEPSSGRRAGDASTLVAMWRQYPFAIRGHRDADFLCVDHNAPAGLARCGTSSASVVQTHSGRAQVFAADDSVRELAFASLCKEEERLRIAEIPPLY